MILLIFLINFFKKMQKYLYFLSNPRVLNKLCYLTEILNAWRRLSLPSKSGRLVSAQRRLMATGVPSLIKPSTWNILQLFLFHKNYTKKSFQWNSTVLLIQGFENKPWQNVFFQIWTTFPEQTGHKGVSNILIYVNNISQML